MLSGPGATIGKARKLRKEMSLPEVLLWQALRKRPNGLKFRRQHPLGPYVLDFLHLPAQIAVEVDGEAHERGDRPYRDEVRDEWLAGQGIRVMRIPARHILDDLEAVVTMIVSGCGAQPLHQSRIKSRTGPPPRPGEEL